jgi:hypothetical protein
LRVALHHKSVIEGDLREMRRDAPAGGQASDYPDEGTEDGSGPFRNSFKRKKEYVFV